jgi:hypothetical protein
MGDYQERIEKLGLNTKDDVKAVIANNEGNYVFLDVRGEDEIAAQAFEDSCGTEVLNVPCSRDDASLLGSKASDILPDKNGED